MITGHTASHPWQSFETDHYSQAGKPDSSDGLVSLATELQGFVQIKKSRQFPQWIDSVSWKPVPGGLGPKPCCQAAIMIGSKSDSEPSSSVRTP